LNRNTRPFENKQKNFFLILPKLASHESSARNRLSCGEVGRRGHGDFGEAGDRDSGFRQFGCAQIAILGVWIPAVLPE